MLEENHRDIYFKGGETHKNEIFECQKLSFWFSGVLTVTYLVITKSRPMGEFVVDY